MKPFSSPIRSMVKSVVMMIGEFEFDAIFNESRDQPPYTITWLLFFIFVIMCTIILMNLLVSYIIPSLMSSLTPHTCMGIFKVHDLCSLRKSNVAAFPASTFTFLCLSSLHFMEHICS